MSPRVARFAAALRGLRACAAGMAAAALGGCAATAAPPAAPRPSDPAAYRIYDAQGRPVDGVASLAEALREVDVVFLGEQHDDASAHRFQHEFLRALGDVGRPVALALEMFERDVQPALSAYLAGTLPEAQFRESSRPWPNYATDYRPLVERARERGWPVIGSNVPRPLAAAVAQRGLAALDTLDPAQRRFVARDVQCPEDAYFQRFSREMQHHGGSHGPSAAADAAPMIRRLYEAQCIKDETMAESILESRRDGRLVVHVNGAFHSDYGHGIVSRLRRRDPALKIAVLSLVPAADVGDAGTVARHREAADYVVLTSTRAGPSRQPHEPPNLETTPMPLYEYACRSCASAFERRRKFEERQAEIACPRCGGESTPVLSAPAMVGAARSPTPARCDTGPTCCGGGMCGVN